MKRILLLCCVLCLLAGCQYISQADETSASSEATQVTTAVITEPSLAVTTAPTEVTEPETTAATEPTQWIFDPYTVVQTMTPEEKVGQLFLAACPDIHGVSDVQTYHLGGYLLFGSDFTGETPESLIQTLTSYQAAADIPLLIAVDEEGGTVARVSAYSAFRSSRFSSPRTLYNRGGMELVISTEEEKCQLLQSLGINMNMAPVCDVTTDPSAFMYQRSLGESPQTTGEFAAAMVQTMNSYHIGSVLKHFPGYGNNTDTHTGIAVDSRSLQTLLEADLIPFAMGIDAGCDAILVSHTIVTCLDDTMPASLSPAVHEYLRKTMNFQGVIVTDDLSMGAITNLYGDGEAAVLAVLAGNDLLCTFHYQTQYTAVLEAVQSGRIPMEIVDDAVARVLQLKYDLGLLAEIQ